MTSRAALVLVLLSGLAASVLAQRSPAAVIIGGYIPGDSVLKETEMFGCAGSPDMTVGLPDYPDGVYLAGARYMDDGGDGYILACGGYACDGNNNCGLSSTCYTWAPGENSWSYHSDLVKGRYANIITEGKDSENTGDDSTHPIVLGYHLETEIWRNDAWELYKDLETRMFSLDCLLTIGNRLYGIRNEIVELDIDRWDTITLGSTPQALGYPQRCSALTINGTTGIYIRYGYFFDVNGRTWTRRAAVPYNPIAVNPNAIWTFDNTPTLFGNPDCDDTATCKFNLVSQYDSVNDEWRTLGKMRTPRRFHEVVEVPGEWCDEYVTPTVPTEPTQAPGTTDGAASMASSLVLAAVSAVLALKF